MWADVLTKPLQGHQFYLMRSKLMGCPVYLSKEESLNAAALLTSLKIKAGVQHDVSKAKAIKNGKRPSSKQTALKDSKNRHSRSERGHESFLEGTQQQLAKDLHGSMTQLWNSTLEGHKVR
jgi:hypothetical protein